MPLRKVQKARTWFGHYGPSVKAIADTIECQKSFFEHFGMTGDASQQALTVVEHFISTGLGVRQEPQLFERFLRQAVGQSESHELDNTV